MYFGIKVNETRRFGDEMSRIDRFRGRILGQKSYKSFSPCHCQSPLLYSFALRFIFLQIHAISDNFYSSVNVHCTEERRKTLPPFLWFNAQKPQRNCTSMNSVSGLKVHEGNCGNSKFVSWRNLVEFSVQYLWSTLFFVRKYSYFLLLLGGGGGGGG